MRTVSAPKLFCLTAKSSHNALLLRRGPSAWCHLVAWDTRTDTFTEGAWFRGRIYEEKCDLSPDGELFLYAAHQGRRSTTDYTNAWTAVSRAPWLHALALWPMGTTYGGGGRFVGRRELTLRGAGEPHPDHPPVGLTVVSADAEYHRSTEDVAGADWSGHDVQNRLIFTVNGRVFARSGMRDVELADFTTLTPNPTRAPDWATRPLRATRT